jgi:SAM-dependent methyltransferase
MNLTRLLTHRIVRQFHRPTGLGGHIAGWIMGHRPSNVRRNHWAVGLLEIEPTDRLLELGCGPGVAIAAAAERATHGMVVGVDHSTVMIRQARRRNAHAMTAGRVRLICSPIDRLDLAGERPFDAMLAVNTVGMWPTPGARHLAGSMRTGGRIALVAQPRTRGATAATSVAAGQQLAALLTDADFDTPTIHTLDLNPPAVCVLARRRDP